MSTKSSSKFWKKFGIGKKSSQASLQPPNPPPPVNNDDKSVKSKRFSGVFLQRKQSTNSLKYNNEIPQPPLTTFPIIPVEHKEKHNTQLPTIEQPHVEQVQENHVEIITPPKVPDLDVDTPSTLPVEQNETKYDHGLSISNVKEEKEEKGKEINSNISSPSSLPPPINDNNNNNNIIPSTSSSSSSSSSSSQKKQSVPKQPVPRQSSSTLPTKLMKPGSMSSFKKGTRSNSSSSITIKNNDNNNNVVPMNTKSTSSISSRNSTNNKETTGNNKSRLRKPTITTAGNNTTSSSTSSSFCHVPSTTSSTTSLKKEEINNTTNTSSLPPPVPSIPDNITDKDQLIRQLQEELQTQLSINRVLQGQKEAITRDLDYFSLTVDELMEEKESLVQKYEEEKINNLTKEEDLNVLLAKLKETTDHARERSAEVDQWKAEIEKTKEEAALELEEVKSVLQRKNQEITQLKGQLDNANDTIESLSSQVKNLSSQVDQLLEQINTHQHQSSSIASQHSAAIETPNPSPQLQAQKYSHDDQDDNNQHQEFVTPLSSFKSSHSNNGFGFSNQQYRNSPPSLTVVTTTNDLDDQLLTLTKTKEKLQSDYSKIPLSGGGPMSRRRKEELEDMLDEVDQQLSRVKQKIRRS